jgi:small-conductance mechanosensitive channel/CRP-like cAMP-binding protein
LLVFLQSNLLIALAGALALVLIAVRTASQEKELKRDLGGAVFLLVTCLGLWSLHVVLGGSLSANGQRILEVGWMLAFAFGAIRTTVAFVLRLARMRDVQTPKILRDVVDFVLYALAALPILNSELHVNLSSLLATSAIVSVVLGMALQETLGNFFSGLSIQIERPFQVGDIIRVQDETGKVVQVTWRATKLETRREVLVIPNSVVAKELVRNYTLRELPIRRDVKFTLSYGAPPNRVKQVLREVVAEIPFVLETPRPSIKVKAFGESGVVYKVGLYCSSFYELSDAEDELLTKLWYRLRREQIEIPYPHRTVQMVEEPPPSHRLTVPQRQELLRSVDLFAALGPAQRDSLAEDLAVRHFGQGERVIEAGAPGNTFYLVAEGSVAVMAGKPAREVTRLTTGQYFGEMSLLTGEPRSATVVAAEDALLLEVDRPTFAKLFSNHPGLARTLSDLLAKRRSELNAVALAANGTDAAPEAVRIFARLRQIFGLGHD